MSDPFSSKDARMTDKKHVHLTYEGWPALAREGFKSATDVPLGQISAASVMGMGGSAAGGEILAGWLAGRDGPEISVYKGQLPAAKMEGELAIACSASGETQETIDMLNAAVKRGASVVSMSSGGRLMQASLRLGVPHIEMPELVAPRYMLPFIIFSSLALIDKALGLDCRAEAEEAFKGMDAEWKEISPGTPARGNPSKLIALKLLQKTPAVYATRVTRGVGIRFKSVLNENSKKHAHFDGIPEALHNEVEAWEDPRPDFAPVVLRHSREGPGDSKRAEALTRLLMELKKNPIEVRGRGESSLCQLLTMVYRLDLVSYYVAIGLGRDPFPTTLIDRLKLGR